MSRAQRERAERARPLALYRCNQFDCKKARDQCQCCNYCVKEATCKIRCQNNSEKCGRFYIAPELFKRLPKGAKLDAEKIKKKEAKGGLNHGSETVQNKCSY